MLAIRPGTTRGVNFPRWLLLVLLITTIVSALFMFTPRLPVTIAYKATREITQARLLRDFADWEVLANKNFKVYYQTEDSSIAPLVLEAATSIYQPVIDILDYEPTKTTAIVVHSSWDDLAENFSWSAHESALGVYWAGVIQILSPRAWLQTDSLDQQAELFLRHGPLTHEYAHVVVDYKANGNYPRWLSEGIAQYVEYKLHGADWLGPEASFRQQLYSLAELGDFNNLTNQNLAYRQSLSLVSFLVGNRGQECLPALLAELGRGTSINVALQKSTNYSLTDLEAEWQAWVAANPQIWD